MRSLSILLLLLMLPGLLLPGGAVFDFCECLLAAPPATAVATAPIAGSIAGPIAGSIAGSVCCCPSGARDDDAGNAACPACCEHCTCASVSVPDDAPDPLPPPPPPGFDLAPPTVAPITFVWPPATTLRLRPELATVRPPPDQQRNLPLLL